MKEVSHPINMCLQERRTGTARQPHQQPPSRKDVRAQADPQESTYRD